jgi:energy-converting hydrogenase Eha subunit G
MDFDQRRKGRAVVGRNGVVAITGYTWNEWEGMSGKVGCTAEIWCTVEIWCTGETRLVVKLARDLGVEGNGCIDEVKEGGRRRQYVCLNFLGLGASNLLDCEK